MGPSCARKRRAPAKGEAMARPATAGREWAAETGPSSGTILIPPILSGRPTRNKGCFRGTSFSAFPSPLFSAPSGVHSSSFSVLFFFFSFPSFSPASTFSRPSPHLSTSSNPVAFSRPTFSRVFCSFSHSRMTSHQSSDTLIQQALQSFKPQLDSYVLRPRLSYRTVIQVKGPLVILSDVRVRFAIRPLRPRPMFLHASRSS